MKLGKILDSVPIEYQNIDVLDLCHDTREVHSGSLYFCLKGSKHDGHDYAGAAAAMNAAAVVCEHDVDCDCPQIIVPNSREAYALASSAFFCNPAKQMKIYGITGTNGKTTTTYILAEILKEAGETVGLIGTNCIRYCGKTYAARLTTPDPVELHRTLREMSDAGVTSVVMEVSAHALALDKTAGIRFDVAGFTNLSRDHLDFFGDMKRYGDAKRKLFTLAACKCAAINADDSLGRQILREAKIPTLGYGTENPADVFGIDPSMSAQGLTYIINLNDDVGEVKFALPGRYNMYNTLCAAAMAKLGGVRLDAILRGIRSLRRVDGRYNMINTDKFSVIIDFAHTDDGLVNIITSVREYAAARVITVFGCGGNRDKSKRGVMGQIAATLSDIAVITSDNPRNEDPESIIADVMGGVPEELKSRCYTEPDRKKAIKLAFSLAGQDDIVIVAGKGAERYQEINGVKYEYNDEEYVMKLLENGSDDD